MEKLVDSGLLAGVIDVTTTEVCRLLMGGVFPATEDRFGAIIRTRMPYVGSVGALDMVNFGAARHGARSATGAGKLHVHNPQVTLMRTTAEENDRMGRWIGERLNRMDGPVRFFLPEGGVSALDAPGQPFHDPEADAALFRALEQTVRQTGNRQLIRVRRHINDPEFAAALVAAFRALHRRRRAAPAGSEVTMPRFERTGPDGEVPRHGRARRADRRRRRRHRALRQMRGGRRHRPHRHLQFRPLPHGRARLARRPAAYGNANAIVVEMAGEVLPVVKRHAGARRRQRHRPVPRHGRLPRPDRRRSASPACRIFRPSA